eukprot:14483405-Alexandrium_andersonii.AAC.1
MCTWGASEATLAIVPVLVAEGVQVQWPFRGHGVGFDFLAGPGAGLAASRPERTTLRSGCLLPPGPLGFPPHRLTRPCPKMRGGMGQGAMTAVRGK